MADEKSPQPQLLSQARKEEIIAALKKKGVPRACPMCSTNNWAIGEGYFNNALSVQLSSISLGGVSIPAIPIICANCGFISQHALGALGLLPQAEEKK